MVLTSLTRRYIVALLLCGFFVQVCAPLVVFAEPGTDESKGYTSPGTVSTQANASPGTKSANNAAETPRAGGPEFKCTSLVPPAIDISCSFAYIAYQLMSGAAYLMGQTGVLLNFAVLYLVNGMGQLVIEMGVGTPWTVLRDIANVFLVFLTLFIGIATILGISSYGSKALLWKVILAALLVNFSLLFTQVIVDVSNLAASAIHTQLAQVANFSSTAGAGCSPSEVPAGEVNPCVEKGIAGAFMTQMGLMQVYKKGKEGSYGVQSSEYYNYITLTSMAAIPMFIVGAFVFGAAALMLIYRFVVLVFLMVVSAPALVMFITRQGGGGSQWWSTLIKESFGAPIMFLMFWVSYIMLESTTSFFVGKVGTGVASTAQNGNIFSVKILFSFIMVCFFLVGSLIIARKLGTGGAAGAMAIGNRWSRSAGMMMGAGAGAATFGVTGALGRRYIGAAGASMAENRNVLERAKNKGVSGWVARQQIKLGERTARASFDGRSLAGKDTQKWTGAAQKGGYAQNLKDWKKEESDLNKKLSTPSLTGEQKEKLGEANKEEIGARNNLREAESNRKILLERLGNTKISGEDKKALKERIANKDRDIETARTKLEDTRKARTGLREGYVNEAKDAAGKRVAERAEQVESPNSGLGAFWDPYTRGERRQLADEARKILKQGKMTKAERIAKEIADSLETKESEGK